MMLTYLGTVPTNVKGLWRYQQAFVCYSTYLVVSTYVAMVRYLNTTCSHLVIRS